MRDNGCVTVAAPTVLPAGRLAARSVYVGVAVLAVLVRAWVVLSSSGGYRGLPGYDPSVYYAAADAMVHGRLPYADFVLLHPPAIAVVLTPFAALGSLTSDHLGFIAATVGFQLVGGVNAALAGVVARRAGAGMWGAAVAGTFYALWFGAVRAETEIRLEPLGNLLFLLALAAVLPSERLTRRRAGLGGVALGAAVCVKLWWVVPLVLLAGWLFASPPRRPLARPFAGGAGLAAAVLAAPFVAAAPLRAVHYLVLDQLARPTNGVVVDKRLTAAFGTSFATFPAAATTVLSAVLVGCAVLAWLGSPQARLVVLIGVAQVVVLLCVPTFFGFYTGYAAPATAVVVGLAGAGARRVARVPGAVLTAAAAAMTVVVLAGPGLGATTPFPAGPLGGPLRHVRCLQADTPAGLIVLNRLSDELRAGCPNLIDVSGAAYGLIPDSGPARSRWRNPRWQHLITEYLCSGDAVILLRPATGLDATSVQQVTQGPVLSRVGPYTVYGTGPEKSCH